MIRQQSRRKWGGGLLRTCKIQTVAENLTEPEDSGGWEEAAGVKKDGRSWAVGLGEYDLVGCTRREDGAKNGVSLGDRVV